MKKVLFLLLSFTFQLVAAPTEVRDWTASGGQKARGSAIEVAEGKVTLQLETGKTVSVPLDRLSEGDRTFLLTHFESSNTPIDFDSSPAGGFPYPLGKITEEIECDKGLHYFLYFPKSLQASAKYPVLYIMDPSSGSPGTAQRYLPGAERNRWIIAVSKESHNGWEDSDTAIDAMIRHVNKTLPVDLDRQYLSGFSGGSRNAFSASQRHKNFAGVLACGAGGNLGSAKQVAYGLCGSNCFNRNNMAYSFKKISSRGSLLRYFVGLHDWASAELCDDAITHLNGVYLSKHKSEHAADYAYFNEQVGKLISENQSSNPNRAYMWACFLKNYGFSNPTASAALVELGKDPQNVMFVKGLTSISEFAQKTFGETSGSRWEADPKIASECLREAKKYAGSSWEKVLTRMAEDAQKF